MAYQFPSLALILLFPALGVVFNVFFGARMGRRTVNLVGPGVIFIAFGFGLAAFAKLLELPAGAALVAPIWSWITAGSFHIDFALRFDALTAVMVLVVSGVGLLIHVYSVGYMAEDADYARFFAYMNLFALAMLLLVLADNLLLMFVGWEGVGLCSYLLIAFWYDNLEFAYNGRKAFIVNRVGDAGFLLGIFTIVAELAGHGVWTLNFVEMHQHAALLQPVALAACLLLFLGATGKSAQLPLYVWLPDAMVGPTPVSALIHAATMVTAGVYMVARLGFLYSLAPTAMLIVASVGTATSFFAATIALVQTDIKRVLAYSTISQIGYMMLGVGTGAFAAGIFHLMTHAFFKALLFLCAGAIIHALSGEQDMRKMGALRHRLPITWITMLCATLAISGIFPFAGFFSKDQVLEGAYVSGHPGLYIVGLITAGLTACYMFRLIFLTFFGESQLTAEQEHHAHEAPAVMTIPLVVLAVLSLVGGWVGLPNGMLWGDIFAHFLDPVVGHPANVAQVSTLLFSGIAMAVAIAGIVVAWLFYIRLPGLPALLAYKASVLYQLLKSKYYVDELYDALISRPLFWFSTHFLAHGVDDAVINGFVDGTGVAVEGSGEGLRQVENGNVRSYAFVYLIGAIGVLAYYVARVLH
jgi:NADH-quinone oxidoreductase subunit L